MIFSELYSAYYSAIGEMITCILGGEHDEKALARIVRNKAFDESALAIFPAIKSGKWQIIRGDMTTPLRFIPTVPLTATQKSWLKSISLDKRIKLFGIEIEGLEDAEPLFTEADYYIYDKYSDGDDFEDEGYIHRFRILLHAAREKMPVKIEYAGKNGVRTFIKCIPERLEYSEKDDKFRLIAKGCRFMSTLNLSRIIKCSPITEALSFSENVKVPRKETLVLEITDERNCLERAMLHFAHFEKKTERVGKGKYLLTLKYDKNDESELVIRILSFGPRIKVISPDSVLELIKEKLISQKNCGLF